MRMLVQEYLDAVRARHLGDTSGAVASYIPELAAVDPAPFGLCVATTDGHVYESGDTRHEFTIQSVSKPFTYGVALADHGAAHVDTRIDVEPSGDAFNEVSLDRVTGRPRNPMINAGAITSASLVAGPSPQARLERVRQVYSAYAGRELSVNPAVMASEARTGDRNRAIGYLLRGAGVLTEAPEDALHVYFGQCSIDVTCHDLSLMAATLANNGVHPRTGERLLETALVERVLSVMTTCGMYNGAGRWVASVGMPAKSGVGGGIIAVLPGQVGIAVFSPRLDGHGNSVRGVAACQTLASGLGLHLMHTTRGARSAVRGSYDVAAAPSRRQRSTAEIEVLAAHGHRARVVELQGDLHFSGAERVARFVGQLEGGVDAVVLDATRVDEVSPVAHEMLLGVRRSLGAAGVATGLIDPDRLLSVPDGGAELFTDANAALQWCEDLVIDRHGGNVGWSRACTLREHPVFEALSPASAAVLTAALVPRTAADGERVVAAGSAPEGLFLILEGQVRASVAAPHGTTDLATFPAGSSFGVLPTVTGGAAATDIHAEGPVTLRVLPLAEYRRLRVEHPAVVLELVEAVLGGSSNALHRAAALG